ncbi:hypothetical protein ACQWKP_24335, partial [Salmonella enterica subsp. enterica serovar Infantis]
PSHSGFFLSVPVYIHGYGWHASVAVYDQHGVFFGVTVNLPDLCTKRQLAVDESIRVWLDQNIHLLAFSYIPHILRTE